MNRFVVADPSRCIGCGACRIACSEGHRKSALCSAARISLVKTREVSAAVTCHQCEGAPCMAMCPTAAIEVIDDHVVVCEETCTGCLLCALACPFGAVYPAASVVALEKSSAFCRASSARSAGLLRQKETGAYASVVMCDLCAGKKNVPQCVDVCPLNALQVVDGVSLDQIGRKRRLRAIAKTEVAMRGAALYDQGIYDE